MDTKHGLEKVIVWYPFVQVQGCSFKLEKSNWIWQYSTPICCYFFAEHCGCNIFIALHQAPLNWGEYVELIHDGRNIKLLIQRNSSWTCEFWRLALPVLQCQIKELAMIGACLSNTIWKWFLWDEATPTPWRSKMHGRTTKTSDTDGPKFETDPPYRSTEAKCCKCDGPYTLED